MGCLKLKEKNYELDHHVGEDGCQKVSYQRMMSGVQIQPR